MTQTDKLVAQISDDALGTAVELRRNRLHERRDLSDFHELPVLRHQKCPKSGASSVRRHEMAPSAGSTLGDDQELQFGKLNSA
jgi:hypothetical protein